MKVFGMCINKNVVAGLAVVGLGIWWMAPEAIGAALPFLLIAICPLSMVLMMKAMNGMHDQGEQRSPADSLQAGGVAVPSAGAPRKDEAERPDPSASVVSVHPRARWN